jgi:hypothetical protein
VPLPQTTHQFKQLHFLHRKTQKSSKESRRKLIERRSIGIEGYLNNDRAGVSVEADIGFPLPITLIGGNFLRKCCGSEMRFRSKNKALKPSTYRTQTKPVVSKSGSNNLFLTPPPPWSLLPVSSQPSPLNNHAIPLLNLNSQTRENNLRKPLSLSIQVQTAQPPAAKTLCDDEIDGPNPRDLVPVDKPLLLDDVGETLAD